MFTVVIMAAAIAAASEAQVSEQALKVHREAIVVDTHCDAPIPVRVHGYDFGKGWEKSQADFPGMKEGGVDAVFFSVFTQNGKEKEHPTKRALEIIDVIEKMIASTSGQMELATSAEEIEKLAAAGKVAALMGMENADPLEESLALLRQFYRLGVRYVGLTHFATNSLSDSATGKPKWRGLSPKGEEVVKEMNRLGMIVDVSHLSDDAFRDILEISGAPVMASHSNCRAICGSTRNLTDEMIKALAGKGGMINVNMCAYFLSQEFYNAVEAREKKLGRQLKEIERKYKGSIEKMEREENVLYAKHPIPAPPAGIVIDHINHAVKLVGVEHVGIGTDYEGFCTSPEGFESVARLPLLTEMLLAEGYSADEVKKILGGNSIDFFRRVAAAAGK